MRVEQQEVFNEEKCGHIYVLARISRSTAISREFKISRLFLLIYSVKCKRTLFELYSPEPYSGSKRKRKFGRLLFMSSIKREIRLFFCRSRAVTAKNVQKSVVHVQSCCFAYSTYCFFDVLLVVVAVVAISRLQCAIGKSVLFLEFF